MSYPRDNATGANIPSGFTQAQLEEARNLNAQFNPVCNRPHRSPTHGASYLGDAAVLDASNGSGAAPRGRGIGRAKVDRNGSPMILGNYRIERAISLTHPPSERLATDQFQPNTAPEEGDWDPSKMLVGTSNDPPPGPLRQTSHLDAIIDMAFSSGQSKCMKSLQMEFFSYCSSYHGPPEGIRH